MKKIRGYNLDEKNIEFIEKKAKEQDRSASYIINKLVENARKRGE